jgi:hypothetical protein
MTIEQVMAMSLQQMCVYVEVDGVKSLAKAERLADAYVTEALHLHMDGDIGDAYVETGSAKAHYDCSEKAKITLNKQAKARLKLRK